MTENSLSGRRSHRKSRTGCLQCKRRKVKCDETKPVCKNCLRHATAGECSFVSVSSSRSSSHSAHRPDDVSLSTTSPQVSASTPMSATNSASTPSTAALRPRALPPELAVLDLELLHHYSTSTSYTLSRHPTLQTVWRIRAPQIGFSSDFVLRGILAIAALHIAHLRPADKDLYLSHAHAHHDAALQTVTPILPTVMDENCTALFVFSSLTCFFSCAKPRKPGDWLLMEGGRLSEWLVFFRATRTILDYANAALRSGPMAPMFINGDRSVQLRNSRASEGQVYVQELKQLIQEDVEDPAEVAIYFGALDELSKSFGVIMDPDSGRCEPSDVFVWLLQVSDEFIALLRESKPVSLVIFAYFCVVIRRLEYAWWLAGCSAHTMSGLYQLLDNKYRAWLQWPMEQIGWVP
ncbi:hypothetical protein VTN77DRAFT_8451 [Rasamsonia byssochlamydoides]|uniref:uncharacterized protein n=1 Tax=Rasamsonia byssochlamydoides TaxID=89139 RepID=UPI0037432C47